MESKLNPRKLKIKNFKNIGVSEDNNSEETLLLNSSFNDGFKGELVILIGPNNVGKSNLIQAIKYVFLKNYDKNKIETNLYFKECYKNITLTLKCDNEANDVLNENGKITFLTKEKLNIKNKIINRTKEICKTNKEALIYFSKLFNETSCEFIINLLVNKKRSGAQNYFDFDFEYSKLINDKLIIDCINNWCNDEFELSLKSLSYNEIENKNFQLNTDIKKLNENDLFKNIFSMLNLDIKELVNAYEANSQQNNPAILKGIEKKYNKKLKKISKDFNDLYSFSTDLYKFEFFITESKIYLSIYKNDIPLTYEYQSTGFQWFFKLYFNRIINELNPGDILLMDEPGVHLHVKGQIELRKFLKQLALDKQITIVFATHSPFLIDLDYLDELRILDINSNGSLKINNKFHCIDDNDTNTLAEIKRALTINNNILFDVENSKIIFVEGITDYNYLTAFKKYFGKYNNLFFLPINGIGTNNDIITKKINEIINIYRFNPILLVDDDKQGNECKKIANGTALNVLTLSDLAPEFKDFNIEDLFDRNDKEIVKEKSFENSSTFKNYIDKFQISDKTKDNFKILLDKLEIL